MTLRKWLFAECYDRLNGIVEKHVIPHRWETAGRCFGDVLEIGAGTGANLPYLSSVSSVTLCEPDRYMRKKLTTRLASEPQAFRILNSLGEGIALPDESFDSVLTTLTLCMVNDVDEVLRQIYRLLRPGGKFFFYEHVLSKHPFPITCQNFFNPIWKWSTTGCNLNRDLRGSIESLPFSGINLKEFTFYIGPMLKLPNIIGYATK